jgi:hypothetical protein
VRKWTICCRLFYFIVLCVYVSFCTNKIQFNSSVLCGDACCRLQSDDLPLLQTREDDGVWYSNAFLGSQLIDWQLNQGDFDTRDEAMREGRRMLENDVLRHGWYSVVTVY